MRYRMVMKRIAIATTDGVSVCDHLARAAAFYVFEIAEGQPAARTRRTRGAGACGNHATFVELLEGCEAVICGGIGQGAAVSLSAHGIAAIVSPAAAGVKIEEALRACVEGRLAVSDERICLCTH